MYPARTTSVRTEEEEEGGWIGSQDSIRLGQWSTGHGVTVPKLLHIRGRQGTRRAGTGMEALESRSATPLLLCEFSLSACGAASALRLSPLSSALSHDSTPAASLRLQLLPQQSQSPVTASGLRVLDGRRDNDGDSEARGRAGVPVLLLLLAPGVPRICGAVNATRPLGAGGWKPEPVLPNWTGDSPAETTASGPSTRDGVE